MYQLEFAEPGRPYRIFSDRLLGIWKYYILERRVAIPPGRVTHN